ncbi:MAG: twin-arginine translocation signal domain-containing protein [Verrucomicrobiales bacterium]|nr:twin-arginine translocation signal domain-containing protein [Verrucomicrobiales bacterium]
MNTDSRPEDIWGQDNRRRFIKKVGVASAAVAAQELLPTAGVSQEVQALGKSGAVPRRAFGRTGVQVSILGP